MLVGPNGPTKYKVGSWIGCLVKINSIGHCFVSHPIRGIEIEGQKNFAEK